MAKLKLATALGTMNIIAKGGIAYTVETLGIPPGDVKLCTGKDAWIGTDRGSVKRVLETFCYGMVDVIGLPHFQLSGEYVAAVLVTFVDPVNWFAACNWVTGTVSNDELAAGVRGVAGEGLDKIRPEELFAMCVKLESHADDVAEAYAANTGAAIERLNYTGPSGPIIPVAE